MKAIYNRIAIILFIIVLCVPSLIWGVILAIGNEKLISSLTYDLGENRNLSELGSISLENSPSEIFESFYDDHLPFRSTLITAHSNLDNGIEKLYRSKLQQTIAKTFYPDRGVNSGLSAIDLLNEKNNENTEEVASTDTVETSTVANSNYDIVVEEVPATCIEDGYVIKKRFDSEDTITEVLSATGHTEEIVEVLEPTYLNYGHTIYECSVCHNRRWADFKEKLIDDSYLPCVIENNMTVLGKFNWLFYRGNASLNYYRGVNILSAEDKTSYLSAMNSLQEICDAKNKTLCYAIFPNKEQVYSEYMPTLEIKNEVKRVPDFVSYVRENSSLNIIYPFDELVLGKLYYDTYYPFDSHWNNAGAFIVEQELLKQLGMETTTIDTLKATLTAETERGLIATGGLKEEDYVGDFDYVFEYKPEVNEISSEILEGYKQVFYSDSTNDKKLVIVGDSFRLRLLQYLEKDFSKVTAIHRDDVRNAKEELQEADIIIVCCVERFDGEMFKNIPTLVGLLK